ncbi:MAG: peptide chain release factor 2 [Candidatus Sungiibacteriota bacterium]|uniref:Peptide chain release factor 2 n=1 Tax=Candidatus Sungiibacteriota bacterium TaxID=2750080 RepID=A0A7T5RJX4_9BACT|nr:MAG: peptide chain release factor 2 [Candidatus Sungbacteria bacterium]
MLWKTRKKKLTNWKLRSANWRTGFDIAGKQEEILKIEQEMQRPDFWADKKRAAEQSQELAALKRESERIEKMAAEAAMLKELLEVGEGEAKLAEEVAALDKKVKEAETELYFSGKYDKGNAVLSIYSGAGGKDAEDWAALLLRMYRRFGEKRGWKTKTIHEHWGENQGPGGWGIKNATILIVAPHAYGYLKKESGVHRLVRISPFSAQSLRHTSFALADVMPEFVAPEEVEIKPEDLKIDFFRSSGPGGQNVNKRETAVRVTHLPTGIQVASQVERTQERNRELALGLLRSRLYQFELQRQEKERQGIRQEKVAVEWGSQIRSYVMHPYQMVKDHRTGVETSNIDAVLDGGLGEFIEAEVSSL